MMASIKSIISVTSPGLVQDGVSAVSSGDFGQPVAVRISNDAASDTTLLVPDASVPSGTVIVAQELLSRLNSTEQSLLQCDWQTVDVVPATSVRVEVEIDEALEETIRAFERPNSLVQRVVDPQALAGGSVWIDIGGVPHQVVDVAPTDRGPVQVVPTTIVEVFAPGNRIGVDIVVLADCSGSMSIPDLPVMGEVNVAGQYLDRMAGLQRALLQLVDRRLEVAGRSSRIALVRFTRDSALRFPLGEGMHELDADSGAGTVKKLRDAIALLRPEQAGTDIGQALHFAAELLHRYGHPGNERLIVLVSDGADWAPKSQDSTGESVEMHTDPVTLMHHLSSVLGIRLHAVGIGTKELFDQWCRAQGRTDPAHVSEIPNHDLLAKLVEFGGGDPSRIGGIEAVSDYFRTLGSGLTRVVGRFDGNPSFPELQPEALDALLSAQSSNEESAFFDDEIRELWKLWCDCNDLSARVTAEDLFDADQFAMKFFPGAQIATTREAARTFSVDIRGLFFERANRGLTAKKDGSFAYPVAEVAEILNDTEMHLIRRFGNRFGAHEPMNATQTAKQSDLFQQLIGMRSPSDTPETWAALQLAIVRMLTDVLRRTRDILQALANNGETFGKAADQAATTGHDFIFRA